MSSPVRSGRRATAHRALWNVAEQVLSSAGSALLALLVARSTDARGFGAFALGLTVVSTSLGISAAVGAQPFQVLHAHLDGEESRRRAGEATGSSAVVGLGVGAVVALAAAATGGPTRTLLLAVALALPLLLVQDTWRTVLKAQGRPAAAAVVMGLMVAVQTAALLALTHAGRSPHGAVLGTAAWALAALVAVAAAAGVARTGPRPERVRTWWRQVRHLAGYYLGDNVLSLGSQQLAVLLMAAVTSATTIGSLRGGQVLLGPLNVLGFSAFAFAVPELTRRPWLRPDQVGQLGAAVSLALAAVAAAYGGLLLLLPTRTGVALLGSTWSGARSVLAALVVAAVLVSLKTGCVTVLRARLQTRAMLGRNAAQGVLTVLGGGVGAAVAGAEGAAWGLAAAEAAMLPLWAQAAVRATRVAP